MVMGGSSNDTCLMNPKQVVLDYYRVGNSNDFTAASFCLTQEYGLVWPQSSERLVGRENFLAVNTEYPAGRWQLSIGPLRKVLSLQIPASRMVSFKLGLS